jgi:hypothetical protein
MDATNSAPAATPAPEKKRPGRPKFRWVPVGDETESKVCSSMNKRALIRWLIVQLNSPRAMSFPKQKWLVEKLILLRGWGPDKKRQARSDVNFKQILRDDAKRKKAIAKEIENAQQ